MTTLGQLVLSGIFIGGIYALMSMGLTLIFGVLRIVNFAHGEFLMLAMYGAWAMTRLLGLNPYLAAIVIVPAMFLFGAIVYQLIVRPRLDKPHLVVVFATMGLSIFMQNVALMVMTADLWDVPPFSAARCRSARFISRPSCCSALLVTIVCTVGPAVAYPHDLSRQGDPGDRAGR